MNVCPVSDIRTGDLLFFSNNSFIGNGLRFFTASSWAHIGIAVRRIRNIKSCSSNVQKFEDFQISLNGSGSLYVLDSYREHRFDAATIRFTDGLGLTPLDFVLEEQNLAAVRPLKAMYSNKIMIQGIVDFIKNYHSTSFPQTYSTFLSVWLGFPLNSSTVYQNSFFCSQMTAQFYLEVLRLPSISCILGKDMPSSAELIAPGHFDPLHSASSEIFEAKFYLFHRKIESFPKIVWLPLVVTLVVAAILLLFLWYFGPSWSNDDLAAANFSSLDQGERTEIT